MLKESGKCPLRGWRFWVAYIGGGGRRGRGWGCECVGSSDVRDIPL